MPEEATQHQDLAAVQDKQLLEGTYSLMNPQVGVTRSGKDFLKCLLRDATGQIAARKWSFDESQLEFVKATGFVRVSGHTQVYNGLVQVILDTIEPVEVGVEQLASLMPTSRYDIEQMYAEVVSIMRSLSDQSMQSLADAYLEDTELMESFKRAPAAVLMHHAYLGGLLEHTLTLLKLAESSFERYPELNRDIVLVGLFLHDLGKTVELEWERGFSYTTEGNLVGHLVRGAIWLQVKAAIAKKRSGTGITADTLRVLQHIVLSHHGQLEHGSPKVPATPEAIFISMLDCLDARTRMAIDNSGRGQAGGTPLYSEHVGTLGTRLYCPDPLAEASTESG